MSAFADISATGSSTGNRVTNAIAMASRRTGVDFSYLLGQAKIESSLNPTARAATSSATGLYQFIDQSWLAVIDKHGSEYGLGWASNAIQQSGGRYYVADPQLRQQILDLRKHPETASVMAAEHAADNKAFLESKLGREAEPVDLYLAHFLGVGGASKFLSVHDRAPDASAASLFPSAARANHSIFYDKQGNARSFAEIRDRFASKLQKGVDSLGGDIQYASAALPTGAKTVQPADYVRIETQRLSEQPDIMVKPQPQTARLAYLMLATLGR
ncbi:lytic transglycosylase domain-containing protein [Sphingobium limneticum]|uniref:Lytic transglycosylase domain-containing protein n=1 Tax=Sphingobium limneticum TaxID=1007511 RepID=A0A5J5I753_9SPHN|nr:lytic transglycosylase domain-containing protein [Sphingobium limneticum]KAA9019798.1 lytic transglycosylase domain-containing protein [Sphingobium limneticum]KAA9032256.1 lytic transglycosylase domain-containing protein [Sphingobium limneticum]